MAAPIQCPGYVRKAPGSRMCEHYVKGANGCALHAGQPCIEFLRANNKPVPPTHPMAETLSDALAASFAALGVEVELETNAGTIFLVPEYTGKDRNEISAAHVPVLRAVTSAFPNARITKFERLRDK